MNHVASLGIQLVLPLPASLGLLALGSGLLALRRRRGGALCLGLGLSWLVLCSMPAFSHRLRQELERSVPPRSLTVTPETAAIVVLGGGVSPPAPPRLSSDLASAADRVLHASRLYRAGKAPLVVLSGGVPRGAVSDVAEARAMAELLHEWGVPEPAIVLEPHSRTTRENCLYVKEILEARSIQDFLLVTSALHMRRALAACRAVGLHPTPSPTDFEAVDASFALVEWLPSAGALEGTSRAMRELFAYEGYRWRGWIADGSRAAGPLPSEP